MAAPLTKYLKSFVIIEVLGILYIIPLFGYFSLSDPKRGALSDTKRCVAEFGSDSERSSNYMYNIIYSIFKPKTIIWLIYFNLGPNIYLVQVVLTNVLDCFLFCFAKLYSITSMARTRMARLPGMIRTLFSVPTKFFQELKKTKI